MKKKWAIVVLISGNGSNLQAIIDAIHRGELDLDVRAVISNRCDAYGLVRAHAAGMVTHVVADERELSAILDLYEVDLICLAGFMRRLSASFVERYARKMLNIHPSLLPKYPGLHTHARALEAGEAWHGATIHWVTEELDAGPIVSYAKTPVFASDTMTTVIARVQALEHKLYPLTLAAFVTGRFQFKGRLFLFDGQPVPSTGILMEYML